MTQNHVQGCIKIGFWKAYIAISVWIQTAHGASHRTGHLKYIKRKLVSESL